MTIILEDDYIFRKKEAEKKFKIIVSYQSIDGIVIGSNGVK